MEGRRYYRVFVWHAYVCRFVFKLRSNSAMTMHDNTSGVANDLIFAASASGPLWQDLLLCQEVAALASELKQDITMERETEDGYFRVKVKGR